MKLLKNTKEVTIKNTRQDIGNLMGWLECELGKLPQTNDTLNWAQVGELKRLRANLLEALTAFSSVRTDQIENSLEDARK